MYQNINSNIFKNIVSNRGHISTVSHKNIPRRPVREFISKVVVVLSPLPAHPGGMAHSTYSVGMVHSSQFRPASQTSSLAVRSFTSATYSVG